MENPVLALMDLLLLYRLLPLAGQSIPQDQSNL
jgi:hypothetical protein